MRILHFYDARLNPSMISKRFSRLLVLLALLLLRAPTLHAQSCTGEAEPNEQPAQATAVNGAQCLSGALQEGDQDFFLWKVSETDASQSWNLSLQGVPTGVTGAQLLRITFAENGTDVAESQKLFALDARDGELVASGPLLLLPSDYYIGLSVAGGEGDLKRPLSIKP